MLSGAPIDLEFDLGTSFVAHHGEGWGCGEQLAPHAVSQNSFNR